MLIGIGLLYGIVWTLGAGVLGAGAPAPQSEVAVFDEALERAVVAVMPEVVRARRRIHAHPELGEREHETAAFVSKWMRELGYEVETGVAATGVVARLTGGKPGPLVAYRADMDGLPITERTGLPFASECTDDWEGEQVGVMHACGHDMHVAVALGVASVLADPAVRAELAGSVMFLFQPAEEGLPGGGVHGAERMLAEDVFAVPPAAIFGLHVNPTLAVGQVSVVPRGAMAAVDRFNIHVRGKQTHGAYPQAGIDSVLVASHIVVALQTIVSRNVDTRDAVVVTVGKIASGNRFNIIPETAELLGTVRTHDVVVQKRVHERIRSIATNVGAAFGAEVDVEILEITPVTMNDVGLLERMRGVLEGAVGAGAYVEERPHMGGEDFAFFANEVPGLYYFLGTSDFGAGRPAMIHTAEFSPDEGALEVGVRTSARLLSAFLGG